MESRRLAPATIRWGQAARTTPQWGLLRPRTIAHAVQPPITLDYWIGWFGARTASGRAAGGFGERNTAARDLARGRRSGEAVPRAPHRPEHLETGRPRLTPLASRTIQPGSLLARLEADASRTTSRLRGHCISTQLRIMEPAVPAAASNNPEGSIRLGRKMWRGPILLGGRGTARRHAVDHNDRRVSEGWRAWRSPATVQMHRRLAPPADRDATVVEVDPPDDARGAREGHHVAA